MKCNERDAKLLIAVMRFTFIQLFFAVLGVSMLHARESHAQIVLEQRISLHRSDASIESILSKIESKTDIRFVYTNNLFERNKHLNVDYKDEKVVDILTDLLNSEEIAFKYVEHDFIVLKKVTPGMLAPAHPASPDSMHMSFSFNFNQNEPPITVSGLVTDSHGPLTGVAVTVSGSTVGSTTGADGRFSLQAPSDGVLTFSLIGYARQQIPVQNRSVINLIMVESTKALDEVVVVGYGTQKKVNLTGAVASISGSALESRPITNLADGLNGLVPNLNISFATNGGQPGQAAQFNIRGLSSIGLGSNNQPLILVDGVERDPNLIDPMDVASVSVLKDASSSAIYGSRAAFGVILITTKTGKKGKPRLSYSGSTTLSRPTTLPKYANSQDYITLFGEAQRTGGASGGYTSSDPLTVADSTNAAAYRADPVHNPSAYIDPANPLRYRYVGNTDWIKVLYPGWAPQQQHNIGLSGGDDNTTYAANMGYFRQDGLEKIANQVYNRYTPSLKLTTKINDWLTVMLSTSLTHTENNKGATTRNGVGGSWIPTDLRPLQPVYNPDGNYSGEGNYTNPVAVLKQSGRDIDKQNDIWFTGRAIITPVNHVSITSDFTYNNLSDFDRASLIPFNEYGVNGAFLDVFPWTNPSQVIETRKNYNYNAFNAYGTYENTFGGKHYFKALVGFNQEYKHYQTDSSFANNLIDPTLPSIGQNNDPKPFVNGVETQYALQGAFYRFNYIYDERYLVEVNGRYDGTSRFGAGHRFAFSPSFSAGWNIAKEAFLKNSSVISELKLRASYGSLPNQKTYDYPSSAFQ